MKHYLLLVGIFVLFLINEFYLKSKITNLFNNFNKFAYSILLILTIIFGLYTYKQKPEILLNILNPLSKKKQPDIFSMSTELINNFYPDKEKITDSQSILTKPNIDLNKNSDNIINNANKTDNTDNTNNKSEIQVKHKRNVSETKKKYVAADQHWKCGNCNNELDASFEVHHKVPLYMGGDNDSNNLVALCRNCHGKETVKDKVSVEN
jgi:hypothetical protein